MIVAGAIVPHAPLLTGAVGGVNAEAVEPVRTAAESLGFDGADALIVLSPHGASTGVYESARGSLRAFGIPDEPSEAVVDEDPCRELSASWGEPLLGGELDHGSLVPLRLLGHLDLPVVCATLEEASSVHEAVRAAEDFVAAISSLDRRIAFVASAHTGAALTARAPLGLRPAAIEADRRLVEWLTTGAGDGGALLEEAVTIGGSCSAGTLAAFARLFAGRARVLSHESPFGVGYLVASAVLQ